MFFAGHWQVYVVYLMLPRERISKTLSTADKLLRIVDARNETSHAYNECFAEELSERIPDYYELMLAIAQRAEKRTQKAN